MQTNTGQHVNEEMRVEPFQFNSSDLHLMILLIYHQSLIFFLGTGNEDTGQAEASILVATLES